MDEGWTKNGRRMNGAAMPVTGRIVQFGVWSLEFGVGVWGYLYSLRIGYAIQPYTRLLTI